MVSNPWYPASGKPGLHASSSRGSTEPLQQQLWRSCRNTCVGSAAMTTVSTASTPTSMIRTTNMTLPASSISSTSALIGTLAGSLKQQANISASSSSSPAAVAAPTADDKMIDGSTPSGLMVTTSWQPPHSRRFTNVPVSSNDCLEVSLLTTSLLPTAVPPSACLHCLTAPATTGSTSSCLNQAGGNEFSSVLDSCNGAGLSGFGQLPIGGTQHVI
ncbi:unnamed protein product [Protopolystoma xenopodis]|uniref:Uncharacterized protein n=1 Tax=Protopolystoma xenopodis TaxID=117903 RepID=A0A448WX25_9PLAT|nr:unnamed protein product [Protopolystoma xenopodis]